MEKRNTPIERPPMLGFKQSEQQAVLSSVQTQDLGIWGSRFKKLLPGQSHYKNNLFLDKAY